MKDITNQAIKDNEAGIISSSMYKDGGTMDYYYDTYTIVKINTIAVDKDVYIKSHQID